MKKSDNLAVIHVFDNYPHEYKEKLLALRELIFSIAKRIDEVKEIEESLKWGQSSYASNIGSHIRPDRFEDDKIALFFHCQTSLVESFRRIFAMNWYFFKIVLLFLIQKKHFQLMN